MNVNISCCYTFNTTSTIEDYGTGFLVGTGSDVNNITSINNSFTTISNVGGTDGRVDLNTVKTQCELYYLPESECIFVNKEAHALRDFTDCDVWRLPEEGEVCLDVFAPELGFYNCP